MNLSSGSGELSAWSSNSQAEGENSQTEVKIGNQSSCETGCANLQGETGLIQASDSPQSENSAQQHLHDSMVTDNGEFDAEDSISGRFQPQNRTNGKFEPASGPEWPQKTNLGEFRPKSGTEHRATWTQSHKLGPFLVPLRGQTESQNRPKICDLGTVLDLKSHQDSTKIGQLGTENPLSDPGGDSSPISGLKSPQKTILKTNQGPVSGAEAQNQTSVDSGPDSGSESQNQPISGDLGPESEQSAQNGEFGPISGKQCRNWAFGSNRGVRFLDLNHPKIRQIYGNSGPTTRFRAPSESQNSLQL